MDAARIDQQAEPRAAAAGAVASGGRPLRIMVLASKPKGLAPSQRFRFEQWAPRLAASHGIAIDLFPFESPRLAEILLQPGQRAQKAGWVLYDFARRVIPVLRARRYDAVMVHREAALLGPAIYERIVAATGVPLLFDFDDAIWLTNAKTSDANGIFSRLHFNAKTSTIIGLSRGVFAGNPYLADYARGYNDNVFIVPTSIELERYPLQPELADDSRFVVVWSGSTSTLVHFEHAREALERLAKKRPLTVKVICNVPPAKPIAGAENVFTKWSEKGEAETLGAAHAGIMPLPADEFARGKCALKALQFMATGRPIVTSPVGVNKELVQSGTNGLLATTPDEWVHALDELASSRELRHRIGMAGRKTVVDGYSGELVSGVFARAVRQLLRA